MINLPLLKLRDRSRYQSFKITAPEQVPQLRLFQRENKYPQKHPLRPSSLESYQATLPRNRSICQEFADCEETLDSGIHSWKEYCSQYRARWRVRMYCCWVIRLSSPTKMLTSLQLGNGRVILPKNWDIPGSCPLTSSGWRNCLRDRGATLALTSAITMFYNHPGVADASR